MGGGVSALLIGSGSIEGIAEWAHRHALVIGGGAQWHHCHHCHHHWHNCQCCQKGGIAVMSVVNTRCWSMGSR